MPAQVKEVELSQQPQPHRARDSMPISQSIFTSDSWWHISSNYKEYFPSTLPSKVQFLNFFSTHWRKKKSLIQRRIFLWKAAGKTSRDNQQTWLKFGKGKSRMRGSQDTADTQKILTPSLTFSKFNTFYSPSTQRRSLGTRSFHKKVPFADQQPKQSLKKEQQALQLGFLLQLSGAFTVGVFTLTAKCNVAWVLLEQSVWSFSTHRKKTKKNMTITGERERFSVH